MEGTGNAVSNSKSPNVIVAAAGMSYGRTELLHYKPVPSEKVAKPAGSPPLALSKQMTLPCLKNRFLRNITAAQKRLTPPVSLGSLVAPVLGALPFVGHS